MVGRRPLFYSLTDYIGCGLFAMLKSITEHFKLCRTHPISGGRLQQFPRVRHFILRVRSSADREPHKLKAVGSIPTPATNFLSRHSVPGCPETILKVPSFTEGFLIVKHC